MYPTPSRNRRAQAKSEERLQSAVPSPMATELSARMSGPSSPTDPGANPGSAGPFRSRSRSPPEPPRSNAAIMAEGGTRNLDEMNLKVPQPGDRSSSAFLTRSSPRSGGYWQSPRDRKAFAQKLGVVADQVHGWTHAKRKRLREVNSNALQIEMDRNTLLAFRNTFLARFQAASENSAFSPRICARRVFAFPLVFAFPDFPHSATSMRL